MVFPCCVVSTAESRSNIRVYGNTEAESSSGVKINTENSYRKKDAKILQRFDGTKKEEQLA